MTLGLKFIEKRRFACKKCLGNRFYNFNAARKKGLRACAWRSFMRYIITYIDYSSNKRD